MKCLIIAAGQGLRLRPRGQSKPLVDLEGTPLIERVMRGVIAGGIRDFVVVTGYEGPRVRRFLDTVAARTSASVTHVDNPDWKRPNGLSVLQARSELPEPFLLAMADHLFDPTIVRDLTRQPPKAGTTVLAVDYRLHRPDVDLDDVTRVQVEEGYIRHIGKGLDVYNAFDTGLFYATPGLFDAIDESIAAGDDASLSGGMRVLADRRMALTFDIGDRFWLDVDGPADAERAERVLRQAASYST